VTRGTKHDYLGMVFDFSNSNKLIVSMNSYVNDMLIDCNVTGLANSPAKNDLFHIKESADKLNSEDKEYFHSVVAKLLYLAKRVRPDILLAISYLASRVREPDSNDMNKLIRVLNYLNSTKDLVLNLFADSVLNMIVYIDAAYGVHNDMKSHSGICIGLGRGIIYSKSCRQKLNCKSSTVAEMIAVSDGLNHVLWIRNFFNITRIQTSTGKSFSR